MYLKKKTKILSIICIVFGCVAIPGGVAVNGLVQDLTYTSIDDGLLGIKKEASPIISELVICAFKAFIMDTMLNKLNFTYEGFEIIEEALTPDQLFNDPNAVYHVDKDILLSDAVNDSDSDLKVGYVSLLRIDGLQKYIFDKHGLSIEFSETTQNLLLNGNEEVPGLISDTGAGSGVDEFLDLYEEDAEALAIQYECSIQALGVVKTYLNEYYGRVMIPLFLEGIPINIELEPAIEYLLAVIGLTLDDLVELPSHVDIISAFMPELTGLNTIDEIAMAKFFDQWANGTLMPSGFPLPTTPVLYGFEVGVPVPTNMSIASAESLWDENNDCALTSKIGKQKWLDLVANPDVNSDLYNELKTVHGIDDHAMSLLLDWIPRFQHDVMPHLAAYVYDLPMDTISLGALIEEACIVIGGALIVLGSACLVVSKQIVSIRTKRNPLPLKIGYPTSMPNRPANRPITKLNQVAEQGLVSNYENTSTMPKEYYPANYNAPQGKYYSQLKNPNTNPAPIRNQTPLKAQVPPINQHYPNNYANRTQQHVETKQNYTPQPQSSQITSPTTGDYINKRKCPRCGAKGFDVREVEDRTRIISYVPRRMYAKKRVCKKCILEF